MLGLNAKAPDFTLAGMRSGQEGRWTLSALLADSGVEFASVALAAAALGWLLGKLFGHFGVSAV